MSWRRASCIIDMFRFKFNEIDGIKKACLKTYMRQKWSRQLPVGDFLVRYRNWQGDTEPRVSFFEKCRSSIVYSLYYLHQLTMCHECILMPNKHSESPKSKAKYSRATNTKTKGENIYRKLKVWAIRKPLTNRL
jgi:hypothetical protein